MLVACRDEYTVLLTAVGSVFTCGDGEHGKLGHGNETHKLVQTQVVVKESPVAAEGDAIGLQDKS